MDDAAFDVAGNIPYTEGDLRPIPHLGADGGHLPPLLALTGYDDRPVSSLEVADDTMMPELHPGDLVVFARHLGPVEDGALHVLAASGGLVVRRLQRMASGDIRAVPANAGCRPEIVGGAEGVRVVGLAIALVRRRL